MKDSIARSDDVPRLLAWFETLLDRGVPGDMEMVALALEVLEIRRTVPLFFRPRIQAIKARLTHSVQACAN